MLELSIEQAGFKEIAVAIDREIGALSDYREAWPEVQQIFYRIEEKAFTSQGSSQGARWKALSPRYAAWKRRHYPGRTILERSGDLRTSLTGKGDKTVSMAPLSYSEHSNVPYARFHAMRGPRFRPPVSLTASDARDVAVAIRRYVARTLKSNFKGSTVTA